MPTKDDKIDTTVDEPKLKPSAQKALDSARKVLKHLAVIADGSDDRAILDHAIATLEQSLATLEHHLK
jgi:hypothetical protein